MLEERPQAEEEKEEGAPHWMTTFADMTTLLLTFFVMLLSVAQMDIIKFRRIMGSIREAFGVQRIEMGEFFSMSTEPVQIFDYQKRDSIIEMYYADMYEAIKKAVEKEQLDEAVEVLVSNRGVIVRAKEKVLFDLGKAELKEEAYPLLDKLIGLMKRFPPYKLAIEGHTDDLPINTLRFPSNWELSSARATRVLRYFISKGIPPARLVAVGYGETRPLVPNDSPENRAKNRRVEFVFSLETDEEEMTRRLKQILEQLQQESALKKDQVGVTVGGDGGAKGGGPKQAGQEGLLDRGDL